MLWADWKTALSGQPLPVACVDLDAFDRNIASVAEWVRKSGSKQTIRVATKSVRVPDLLKRILDQGAPFRGLMTFSARETLDLARLGFDDFFLGYPIATPADAAACCEVVRLGKKLVVVIDSAEHIQWIERECASALGQKRLNVALELDASLRIFGQHLGVRRSPIRSLRDLERMIGLVRKSSSLELGGLMSYEAQVAGLGDRNPFKCMLNPVASIVRRVSMARLRLLRQRASELVRGLVFNGGGSGSLNWTLKEPWLTEVTVGSGFFSPHLFDYYSNIHFEPAAFFALPVVRSSDSGLVTCLGGGYIASGEPGWDRVPRPWLPEGLKLVSTEGCGEVQTPLRTQHQLALGDPVLFRHAKAGELMERFAEVVLMKGGRIAGRVTTYRGAQIASW